MLNNKNVKIISVIYIVLFLLFHIFFIRFHCPFHFYILFDCLLLLLYFISIKMIISYESKIILIAESIKDNKVLQEHKYEEGAFGKLTDNLQEMETVLSSAEQKQRKEKEFLQDIISDISHQLKTPVASLTLFQDILMNKFQEKNSASFEITEKERMDICNILEQSEKQILRINWLIQSILQLARLEALSIQFDIQEIRLRFLVDSCIDLLQANWKAKNISFQIEVSDITLQTDEEWLKEALINILKNAIEYSEENSVIDIFAKKTPIATKISIKDYGPGIKESEQLNVFKRFFRGDNHSTNASSVGIGLALAKSIIESLGGKIWVESKCKQEISPRETSYTCINIMF